MAEIYANLEKVAGLSVRGAKKLGEELSSAKADADLSYLLATIKTNVELDITPDQLVLGQNNQDQLIEYFARYEFKRWLNEVISGESSLTKATQQEIKLDKTQTNNAAESKSAVKKTIKIDRTSYETIDTQEKLNSWLEKLQQADLIAVDTETDALDPMHANLVGISFALTNSEACYIPHGS